jgi:phage gpG-like protein
VLLEINATVKIGGVLAAFHRMSRGDFSRTFRRLRKPMHKDMRHHRDLQRGPAGPWAPLAASTKERYAREGKRRNRRVLARLPNARKTKATADRLVMFSPVKWSMAHQDGPTRVGRGSLLPQRQFFWISRSLRLEAVREFERTLNDRWHGRR